MNKTLKKSINSLEKVNIIRDPEHKQLSEFTMLQLNHQINENVDMVAKATYSVRDYYHMGDNDYSVAVQKFPGLFPAGHPAAAIPMQWTGCFGGENGWNRQSKSRGHRTYDI